MANNGFLVSGVCTSSFVSLAQSLCPSETKLAYFVVDNPAAYVWAVQCLSSSYSEIKRVSPFPAYNCEIQGPALTETEQIQAVNQFLPYALAFLAAIWGGKKVFDVLWGAAFRPRRTSDPE